jgi:hypothetical protein
LQGLDYKKFTSSSCSSYCSSSSSLSSLFCYSCPPFAQLHTHTIHDTHKDKRKKEKTKPKEKQETTKTSNKNTRLIFFLKRRKQRDHEDLKQSYTKQKIERRNKENQRMKDEKVPKKEEEIMSGKRARKEEGREK